MFRKKSSGRGEWRIVQPTADSCSSSSETVTAAPSSLVLVAFLMINEHTEINAPRSSLLLAPALSLSIDRVNPWSTRTPPGAPVPANTSSAWCGVPGSRSLSLHLHLSTNDAKRRKLTQWNQRHPPDQQSGIQCLIICAIQLLTPNNLGGTWRR